MKARSWIWVLGLLATVSAVMADEPVDLVRAAGERDERDASTSLLYVKTTDYGQTWTPLMEAGSLPQFAPGSCSLGDLGIVATLDNELCYVAFLQFAPVPGVYALRGPAFAPVLIMAEGNNNFQAGAFGSWADVGRLPNGDLVALIWGFNPSGQNTLWGSRSLDQGYTWGTPFVIATRPTLPEGNLYPHIAPLNHESWCFVVLQDQEYRQYALRFPTAGGAGSLVPLNAAAGTEVSYYTGNCQPIAFDPTSTPPALYITFRNSDLTAATTYYSGNLGASFSWAGSVVSANRYPSITLRSADDVPFVSSNYGVPSTGTYHRAWFSHDEGGYQGGLWTPPVTLAQAPAPYDGTRPLFYMNQLYWWDGARGVAMNNYWGIYTPEAVYSERTTNGGTAWSTPGQRLHYETDGLGTACLNNAELVGGSDGVAYIATVGPRVHPVTARLPELSAEPGSTIHVPVDLEWMEDWSAFRIELHVNFNRNVLEVVNPVYDQSGGTIPTWEVIPTYNNTVGWVRLVMESWTDPLSESGRLIDLVFRVRTTAPCGESSDLNVQTFTVDDGVVPSRAVDGLVTVYVPASQGWLELIHSGPSDWGYRLHVSTGCLDRIAFTNFCHGTSARVSGDADYLGWAPLPDGDGNDGDSIIFVASVAQMGGTIDTFWLSHPDCADRVVWCAGDSCGDVEGPLPVELTAFTAVGTEGGIQLSFATASETDNAQFEIWRGGEPQGAFTRIAVLPSQGNSTSEQRYSYLDEAAQSGTPYWYYLADVDLENHRTEHRNRMCSASRPDAALPTEYALSAYPNPFNAATTLAYALPERQTVAITLFDLAGRRVATLLDGTIEAGTHRVRFDGHDLPTGVYMVRMEAADFSRTIKLLLLK